jgi:hypothetical protein
MTPHDFLHLTLVLYVLAGYVAAYQYARHSFKRIGARRANSSLIRVGSWFLIIVMPLFAITAFYASWNGPFFPLLVGATMNVFWFYAACLGVLRDKSAATLQETKQARRVNVKPLKSVYLGGAILFLACMGFATAMVLKVATPQALAGLLALVMIAVFVGIYRGLRAAQR